jgi:D-beta-D-heptose 7-phosphate kinase/D-beta-D-heptose 1-phosphate adenosyltransferase
MSAPGKVPVLSIDELATLVAGARRAGRVVVFTNGVFDVLHPGHLRYLQASRRHGDVLVVAVNSDRSVRAIKGETRPVTPEHERAEMLAALSCVDAVVVFDEDTPAALIERLEPDVLVKGEDWKNRENPGRAFVERRGGRMVFERFEPGYSATAIIEKVRTLLH